jgi:hypothetical protein
MIHQLDDGSLIGVVLLRDDLVCWHDCAHWQQDLLFGRGVLKLIICMGRHYFLALFLFFFFIEYSFLILSKNYILTYYLSLTINFNSFIHLKVSIFFIMSFRSFLSDVPKERLQFFQFFNYYFCPQNNCFWK